MMKLALMLDRGIVTPAELRRLRHLSHPDQLACNGPQLAHAEIMCLKNKHTRTIDWAKAICITN